MKVGKYQIGRLHAIIKCEYEDGSVDYETRFSDERDLRDSFYACRYCLGTLCGTARPNPRVLKAVSVIRGKENIIKELSGAE